VSLLDAVLFKFTRLAFSTRSGEKADVNCDFDGIEFTGDLSFLNSLAFLIPMNGFSDPPFLDIDTSGVTVGFSLSLPDITAGAWAFRNIGIFASLRLPFIGDPARLYFSFAERSNPFLVTYNLLTGGAFFGVGAGLDGIELVESAVEAGGSLALNLGVASGAVYAMTGIYFGYQFEPEKITIAAYMRMGGALVVLGLICVSLVFYMELNYETTSGTLIGSAELSVEVSLGFFEKTVKVGVTRQLAGPDEPQAAAANSISGAVALLEGETDADAWDSYFAAFA
jgi:hypothetical protein